MLDEATSHLDAVSEARSGALDALIRDRATIVIEAGSHAELLACGGLYARLIRHQLEATLSRCAPPAISQ